MDANFHDTKSIELGRTKTLETDKGLVFYTRDIVITTRNGRETLTMFSEDLENLGLIRREEK